MTNSLKESFQKILDSADIKMNGNRKGDIKVNNEGVYKRALIHGSLGLGESYMDGDWDCAALDEFFYKITKARLDVKAVGVVKSAAKFILSILSNPQSKSISKKVIEMHYNLGNDLYEAMLDKNMQYTCAYWKNAKNIDEAQIRKLEMVAKKLKLKPGMKVLELGGGFGGLARYLAKNYKVKVESYNISRKQIKFGREICKGLPVIFHEKDYREAKGEFDRVVSIGLMEHVGPKNYIGFMKLIERNLKKGGLALVHTIGRNTGSRYPIDPWIGKYIFPGGHLPSISQLTKAAENLLVVEDIHNFGPDYDKTLMAWYENTNKNWSKLKDKYEYLIDGKFKRMWDYYLLSCAGAFRSRSIQLWQTILSKNYEERYEGFR